MSAGFTESVVEDAALGWLEALSCAVLYGRDMAAREPDAERGEPGRRGGMLLKRRLSAAGEIA